MTKKHFIELADVVRELHQVAEREHGVIGVGLVVDRLADFCASQNPHFNRGRWLDYIAGKCGPNGGSVKKAA